MKLLKRKKEPLRLARQTEWGEIEIKFTLNGRQGEVERRGAGFGVQICYPTIKYGDRYKGEVTKTERRSGFVAFSAYELAPDLLLRQAAAELYRRMHAGSGDAAFVRDGPLITTPLSHSAPAQAGSSIDIRAIVELPARAKEIIAERRRRLRGKISVPLTEE